MFNIFKWIILCAGISAFAQSKDNPADNLLVKYDYQVNHTSDTNMPILKTELYIGGNFNLFGYLGSKMRTMDMDTEDNQQFSYRKSKDKYMVVDFDQHIFWRKRRIKGKRVMIKDSVLQIWTILSLNSEKVLGFDCFAAKTEFRGRAYTAWFTPEIPMNYGPWKFHGLPGLILKVESEDGYYTFEATSINCTNINDDYYKNMFLLLNEETKTYVPREEYVQYFQASQRNREKAMQSSLKDDMEANTGVESIEVDLSYNTKKYIESIRSDSEHNVE